MTNQELLNKLAEDFPELDTHKASSGKEIYFIGIYGESFALIMEECIQHYIIRCEGLQLREGIICGVKASAYKPHEPPEYNECKEHIKKILEEYKALRVKRLKCDIEKDFK
jgi:hypothetical protein